LDGRLSADILVYNQQQG